MPGPDFSAVDAAKAEELFQLGQLERLHLMPLSFGGQDIPPNTLYVPIGIADVKAGIDENIIRPLVASGQITSYSATPAYVGTSFVPISVTIEAANPGSFTTTINIWGPALDDKD